MCSLIYWRVENSNWEEVREAVEGLADHWKDLGFIHRVEKTLKGSGQRTDNNMIYVLKESL